MSSKNTARTPLEAFLPAAVFGNQNAGNLKYSPKDGKKKFLVKHLVIEDMQVIMYTWMANHRIHHSAHRHSVCTNLPVPPQSFHNLQQGLSGAQITQGRQPWQGLQWGIGT